MYQNLVHQKFELPEFKSQELNYQNLIHPNLTDQKCKETRKVLCERQSINPQN